MFDGIIIYYNDTLYNRESRYCVAGDIEFKDGMAHFNSMGRRYAISIEQIIRIVDGRKQ